MSRIETLQLKLEAHKEKMEASIMQYDACKEIVAQIEAELAALKAESDKPGEWQVYIGRFNGRLYLNFNSSPYGTLIEPITVIEKKPIVVTREMAMSMYLALCDNGDAHRARGIAKILNTFGIEARCGDE